MIDHTPIFVTGCQRSGLSMTSAILHVHGVWSGEQTAQKISKMSFSNKRLWKDGFDSFFHPVDNSLEKGFNEAQVASHIESLLIHQGFRGGYWLMKNHKLIEHQEQITKVFPKAIWIHVRRSEDDILKSCLKTFPLGLKKSEEEWKQIISQTMKKMDDLSNRASVYTIHPERFFKGDFSEIQAIIYSVLEIEWMGDVVKELFKKVKNGKSN